MSKGGVPSSIATPARPPGLLARLLAGPTLPGLAARIAARFAPSRPVRLGKRVIAIRHAHVRELLGRDLDFGIAAVNVGKIEEVNGGPFILGMDRSAALERERRALYKALAAVDLSRLREGAAADAAARLAAVPAGGTIDAVEAYARPIAARTAQGLFGINGPDDLIFMEVARSIFAHTFLNLGGDEAAKQRGIEAGRLMQAWLAEEIARRRANAAPGDDLMGQLIRQGLLDDDAIRRALGGMMVGSIDTTATCVAKILTVIGREPGMQYRMQADLADQDRLYGWCLEALRKWPHNPILLREATAGTSLSGRTIGQGERVIAWTEAAMLDPAVFPGPTRLRPDRDRAAYLHFGGGLHPCSGRAVNRFQIPLLVGALVSRGLARIGSVRWAGPFPGHLDVTLREGSA
ncbi:cytochrome P450 [Sphingosinicella terrae]|uniref:cytochrome P450 n=1 Tax=Sphingosinicella terrae TaxID=2172047 RepID=UPI000E0D8ADC|nr:cytochrome P450 [Sphingosinicella terrae]